MLHFLIENRLDARRDNTINLNVFLSNRAQFSYFFEHRFQSSLSYQLFIL
jgi:hypothetical protein